jgi:hypothetical protein
MTTLKLTTEEMDKLIKKLGKEKTEYYMESLENYLLAIGKPNKYKSHYHAILCWYMRDNKKNLVTQAISSEFKDKNIRWLKDKISQLERIGAKGNMKISETEVYDSVIGKRICLDAKNLIDIVTSWDQFRR